jgi:hypothetical protein
MNEVVVAAMRIDDHNLLKSVARDLTAGVLEQADRQIRLDANAAGVMPRFEDLCEDKIREHDGRLQRRGAVTNFAPNEHIGRKRQVMPMPLDAG